MDLTWYFFPRNKKTDEPLVIPLIQANKWRPAKPEDLENNEENEPNDDSKHITVKPTGDSITDEAVQEILKGEFDLTCATDLGSIIVNRRLLFKTTLLNDVCNLALYRCWWCKAIKRNQYSTFNAKQSPQWFWDWWTPGCISAARWGLSSNLTITHRGLNRWTYTRVILKSIMITLVQFLSG